ncbi:MAG TPA: sulfate adenylyltransferase [Thermoplasmata archaeon]|nr:sulfate adenylyltransferase [Thermoplasmata archaeon]
MIPEPHGGRLVDRCLSEARAEIRRAELRDLPKIRPFIDELYDAEKIAVGAYSPLEGFMGQETLGSVLTTGRLPGGLPWSIPILLAPRGGPNEATVGSVRPGDEVALLGADERLLALLRVEEKFPIDKKAIASATFGTIDPTHPNVADLLATGSTALAGRLDLVERMALPTGSYEWTPSETRERFRARGWKNVAAYQCRNPPHTAHEYLQRLTLEREEIDGLFIHPVVGRLKPGDYRPDVILRAYHALVEHYHPKDRVLLAAFSIAMRYAGPKAALFLAIVRQNFGCSHYIVGRDQAGVGRFYDPYAAHRIFDEFPLGIRPLRYEETFYCKTCGWMATVKTCGHPVSDRLDTSQTRIRKALAEGRPPPAELVRPEVAEVLRGPDVLLRE